MDAWIHAWLHGCMDGCMDGYMDGWMHGFYEFQSLPSVKLSSPSKTPSSREGGEQQGGGRAIKRRASREEREQQGGGRAGSSVTRREINFPSPLFIKKIQMCVAKRHIKPPS